MEANHHQFTLDIATFDRVSKTEILAARKSASLVSYRAPYLSVAGSIEPAALVSQLLPGR